MSNSSSPLLDSVYPPPLRATESLAIAQRRSVNQLPADAPTVGFALSGGGIRSATFCIGLFQALARQRLIRRIDFLSTVSGGGYFGSFLGIAFARGEQSADAIESSLADNQSWLMKWLRQNGRFLSPNGAGDNWVSAAVALRNWVTLHVVILSFLFLLMCLSALIRIDLTALNVTRSAWLGIEQAFFYNQIGGFWWSPWVLLAAVPLVGLMLPTGVLYWFTQSLPLMSTLRRIGGFFHPPLRTMSAGEFAGHAQNFLTRAFKLGFIPTIVLLLFATIDSIGQTVYWRWSAANFQFPALWATLTGTGIGLFGLAARMALYVERMLGNRKLELPVHLVALGLALTWFSLIIVALSVVVAAIAWQMSPVWDGVTFFPMWAGWELSVVAAICFVVSWICSRSFSFVNLSSMQQIYAARLCRAYLGATNPERRRHANYSMTDLIPGDDLLFDHYVPHRHGGPLHLINVTVNETLSGKTQIERRDRKGVIMAVSPCGLSVGKHGHGLWATESLTRSPFGRRQALWEQRQRPLQSLSTEPYPNRFDALAPPPGQEIRRVETLTLGRWVAISGAAFTTGTGANTHLGLSLLLGLGNVRLGYWWDSGGPCQPSPGASRPTFLDLVGRLLQCVLPVQTCLANEFFARFHGPTRRHWYLSDGGHFENTGCYELIRRRVPFIVCSDAGQDDDYRFDDFANLVRMVRTDFGAEIQVVQRRLQESTDEPDERFPMPRLEDLVHPALLNVIGTPDDFAALTDTEKTGAAPRSSRAHAFLARIHYADNDTFCWMLVVKPSLAGDESADVRQYQRTHPLFPQEPTTDQYFDEAQWESYRKLGEHIGTELFTPPGARPPPGTGTWSPSLWCGPETVATAPNGPAPAIATATVVRADTGVPA